MQIFHRTKLIVPLQPIKEYSFLVFVNISKRVVRICKYRMVLNLYVHLKKKLLLTMLLN